MGLHDTYGKRSRIVAVMLATILLGCNRTDISTSVEPAPAQVAPSNRSAPSLKQVQSQLDSTTAGQDSYRGQRSVDETTELSKLLKKAFEMAGESVPLGFDVSAIQPTLAKLPAGSTTGLEPLFTSVWPSNGT